MSIPETPQSVSITSGSGNVNVAADSSATTVTAEISASGDEPPWSAELVGTELVIDDGCGARTDCEVNLVIAVAGTADVSITSAGGGVTVVDMNSAVTIAGTASNVLLNGITGPIDVNLDSGDMLGARLVTTTGSFRTGAGNIDVTLTEPFESLVVTSGSGDVKAQVPDGGYDITATTRDGSVEIDVDDVDGAPATIEMQTGSGDVTIYRR